MTRSQISRLRRAIRYTLIFALFFISYRFAPQLSLIDQLGGSNLVSWFNDWQTDSDSLVLGRLDLTLTHNVLYSGGSLAYPDGVAYRSQFGLAGWLLSSASAALGGKGIMQAPFLYSLVAAINAGMVTVALIALSRVLSVGAAILAGLALVQPWPTALFHSIYWIATLKLLPAAGLLIFFHLRSYQFNQYRGSLGIDGFSIRIFLLTVCLSIVVFLSGYEFLTVTFATALAATTYYLVYSGYGLKSSIFALGATLAGLLSGFLGALFLHLLQLSFILNGLSEGLEELAGIASRRTGASAQEAGSVYEASIAESPVAVLTPYLNMPIFGSPDLGTIPLVGLVTVTSLLLISTLAVLVCVSEARATGFRSHELALGISWFIVTLGPIGWYLLAKPHSFIHYHINYVLWYIPTIPLGLAILWPPLRRGVTSIKGQPVLVLIPILVLFSLVAFFTYSLITTR